MEVITSASTQDSSLTRGMFSAAQVETEIQIALRGYLEVSALVFTRRTSAVFMNYVQSKLRVAAD